MMEKKQTNSPKRLDLQGIRGIAIIVVLGFHFYPQYMPNGYLGVDQFFVLSGFLMCMLLKRAEEQTPCSLVSLFYSKRFKRILPLYLLLILLSMIALYNFFPDTAIETNQESATHALLFVSNRPRTVQENYFAMLSLAVDIFTHTWSLSVEIQFYFLVPIIFIFGNRFSETYQYVYYSVLGCISFLFFFFSTPTVSFNSVFARIWQFLIGMVVYTSTVSKKSKFQYRVLSEDVEESSEACETLLDEEEESTEFHSESTMEKFLNPTSYFLLVCLIFILTFPFTFAATIFRPLITVSTGILMLISGDNKVLSNRILTYIGDISYSLYLIHWPIYAYWKLTANGDQYKLFTALVASVILAVITFETFEKWYLKLSSTSIGVLVVILFLSNVVVINKNEISDHISSFGKNITSLDGVTENMTIDDAPKLNYRWSVNDNKNLFTPTCVYESLKTPLGWCRHTGLSPSAKYKFATIGNSWTANHATMFYQECSYKAKSIIQGSAYGCEPLYPTRHSKTCTRNFTAFEERVRKEKPDYVFMFTRFISIGDPFPKNVTKVTDDPMYKVMLEQALKFIKNIKYKMFILDSIPRLHVSYISKIPSMLKNETDPREIDKLLIAPELYENARKRHAQLLKDCGKKCVLVDYIPEFYNNDTNTFRYYDERGFSYFTTPSHLSPHGVEHVRHVWRDICKKL